jgi:hypothetical protein
VTVNRSLDFERTQRYLVTIVASVRTTAYWITLSYKYVGDIKWYKQIVML